MMMYKKFSQLEVGEVISADSWSKDNAYIIKKRYILYGCCYLDVEDVMYGSTHTRYYVNDNFKFIVYKSVKHYKASTL